MSRHFTRNKPTIAQDGNGNWYIAWNCCAYLAALTTTTDVPLTFAEAAWGARCHALTVHGIRP